MLSTYFWHLLIVILFTAAPGLELRAGIPYGILIAKLHWSVVFSVSVITNILVGTAAFVIIDKLLHIFLRSKKFTTFYTWYHHRVQQKIHPLVQKYGDFGLALFIAVPLPGTGSYSGAVGAHLLGMRFKSFFLANMIGVLIAGIIVLFVTLFGSSAWSFLVQKPF